MVAMIGLWLFSELGSVYVLAMLGLTCWWLYKGVTLRPVDALWGRALFIASLKVLMGFSLMLVLSPFLP
jgi:heme O synthase-like polyprenyltransferase